jgi:hypothetical protein
MGDPRPLTQVTGRSQALARMHASFPRIAFLRSHRFFWAVLNEAGRLGRSGGQVALQLGGRGSIIAQQFGLMRPILRPN